MEDSIFQLYHKEPCKELKITLPHSIPTAFRKWNVSEQRSQTPLRELIIATIQKINRLTVFCVSDSIPNNERHNRKINRIVTSYIQLS